MHIEGERYATPAQQARRVAVFGAGSWGTALALHCARAGHSVTLWGRDASRMRAMDGSRRNVDYLPGAELPPTVALTADSGEALKEAQLVVSAIPSRHTRALWRDLREEVPAGCHMISASKGIEEHTGARMSVVLGETLEHVGSVSSLSGPSFAVELAAGHPTAVTLACDDAECAHDIQRALSAGALRVYRSDDLVGVEMGGALKNIIAIAAGIVDGLGFGSNTQAALISRGLKEMSVLAVSCGARADTLMGLAGLGDLVLTCTGPLSRNRSLGVEIAEGKSLEEITAAMTMVAEGAVTTRSAFELAQRHGVDMPISRGVHAVLYEGLDPRTGIEKLLSRALAEE